MLAGWLDGWMAGKWIVDSGKWEVGCGMWEVGCGMWDGE